MLRCLVVAPIHSAELEVAFAQKGCACFAYFAALGAPMVARMVHKVLLCRMAAEPLDHMGLALQSRGGYLATSLLCGSAGLQVWHCEVMLARCCEHALGYGARQGTAEKNDYCCPSSSLKAGVAAKNLCLNPRLVVAKPPAGSFRKKHLFF